MEIVEIKEFSPTIFKAVKQYTQALLNEDYLLEEDHFRQIVELENSHLFLITSGENFIGMLTLAIYKTPTGTKGWIEDVIIDNTYRGQGLGKKLVGHAISFAEASGVSTLMLTSNPARIAANKLYQNLGFEQKETNLYRMKFDKDRS